MSNNYDRVMALGYALYANSLNKDKKAILPDSTTLKVIKSTNVFDNDAINRQKKFLSRIEDIEIIEETKLNSNTKLIPQ